MGEWFGGRTQSLRPTLARGLASFALASVVLIAVIGAVSLQVVEPRLVAHDLTETRRQVDFVATRIVQPGVRRGVISGAPDALAVFDRYVRERVLRPGVLQVKLWTEDGVIRYSDATELIGRRYALGLEQRELFDAGTGSTVERSALDQEEHAGLPPGSPVVEIYVAIRGPDGETLLWESYVEQHRLVEQAESLLVSFVQIGAVAAGLLVAVQIALALALVRSLVRRREMRIDLLQRSAAAAQVERRRISGQLHDGVVQDLQGLALDLDTVGTAAGVGLADTAARGSPFAARLRSTLQDLRKLAVDIHPPDLHSRGLGVALDRLFASCDGRVVATLDVEGDAALGKAAREQIFRAAQEGVRNVLAHADASRVHVEVRVDSGRASLAVTDDGRGFVVGSLGAIDGHLGLALLADMAEVAGGQLELRSTPAHGTSLRMEVPA